MPDVSNHTIVVPNGTIILYDDVPLDSEYTHSINRYATNTELVNTLNTYPHHTLYNQSYSRLTENSVRVGLSKEELLHCNYIAIRNGAYYASGETNILTQGENKIYYGFVTEVEYVNNQTSNVFFTIDYLQTYWNNFTIPANFIEREHCLVSGDVVGKNLIPESFELGEYLINNYYHKNYATDLKYNVIMYLPNTNENNAYVYYDSTTDSVHQGVATADQFRAGIRNGFGDVPCCLAIPASSSSNANVSKAVTLLLEKNAQIIDVVQISGEMYIDNFTSNGAITRTLTFDETATFKRTDGTLYNPRNKKLLNSPFRKLIVTNNNGQNAEYNWELFETRYNNLSRANFSYVNAFLPTPIAVTYPRYYRGKAEDYENNVTLDDFPKVNWSEDSFTKWWAQNKANFGISLATGALTTGLTIGTAAKAGSLLAGQIADKGAEDLANFATANQMGFHYTAGNYKRSALNNFEREQNVKAGARRNMAISGAMGANGIARTLGQVTTAKATPDNANVQKNTALINVLTGHFGFTYYDMAIAGEMAEIIDSYFDMYGYACHKVKVPNFIGANRRPIWNYIKMQNAFIKSQTGDRGLPEAAQTAIQGVFNNGITLWNDITQVGNYNNAEANR